MERNEIMQVVCEVADMAIRKHADVEGFEVNMEVNGEIRYTEEAQIKFDAYYDNYDEFATKWMNKYPTLKPYELRWDIMAHAGIEVKTHSVEWEDCAIEFDFNPPSSGYSSITEIYFEPGWYMWNEHTILNWKTMTPEFDFVYLIEATGERVNEDGTPKFPELYRLCDKGVVVRKLSREHESGRPRPSYENRSNECFIIDVPGKVRISGEEFHFFEKVIPREV